MRTRTEPEAQRDEGADNPAAAAGARVGALSAPAGRARRPEICPLDSIPIPIPLWGAELCRDLHGLP